MYNWMPDNLDLSLIDELNKQYYYTGHWEERKSAHGDTFWVFKKEMPRIKDIMMDCSIYLYHSEQDAKDGEKSGGSGFLVSVPSEVIGYNIYAVTNSHVIREAASPVIRLNTINNDMAILNCTDDNWIHHPKGDDIAVCPLIFSQPKYKFSHVPINLFINQDIISRENIGAGDEVYMIGRFIGYDGIQHNAPTVRFGNMSIGSPQPILHERGYLQESYLIETRSLSGYSGSPVFVLRGWLLGIDWGHKHFLETVLEKNGKDEVPDKWKVRTNSGITCVIPAWKLLELLNTQELIDMRKKTDQKIKETLEKVSKQKMGDVSLDTITRDQFHAIIRKAAQPVKKEDEPKSDLEKV